MTDNTREKNPNQHQGQDKAKEHKQHPGQAGGDQMPGKEKNQQENQNRSNKEHETNKNR